MKDSNSPTDHHEIPQNESLSAIVMAGIVPGCIFGTIVMLVLEWISGGFVAMLVGSGLIGPICFMPITLLILGGIPGGVFGGVIYYLAIQIESFFDKTGEKDK